MTNDQLWQVHASAPGVDSGLRRQWRVPPLRQDRSPGQELMDLENGASPCWQEPPRRPPSSRRSIQASERLAPPDRRSERQPVYLTGSPCTAVCAFSSSNTAFPGEGARAHLMITSFVPQSKYFPVRRSSAHSGRGRLPRLAGSRSVCELDQLGAPADLRRVFHLSVFVRLRGVWSSGPRRRRPETTVPRMPAPSSAWRFQCLRADSRAAALAHSVAVGSRPRLLSVRMLRELDRVVYVGRTPRRPCGAGRGVLPAARAAALIRITLSRRARGLLPTAPRVTGCRTRHPRVIPDQSRRHLVR